jgi:hypothetical protein
MIVFKRIIEKHKNYINKIDKVEGVFLKRYIYKLLQFIPKASTN